MVTTYHYISQHIYLTKINVEEHRSIVVRALAFGAGGPRFKSRRGENYFSYTNPNFILSNRREGARQLTRRASAVRKMNAQIF